MARKAALLALCAGFPVYTILTVRARSRRSMYLAPPFLRIGSVGGMEHVAARSVWCLYSSTSASDRPWAVAPARCSGRCIDRSTRLGSLGMCTFVRGSVHTGCIYKGRAPCNGWWALLLLHLAVRFPPEHLASGHAARVLHGRCAVCVDGPCMGNFARGPPTVPPRCPPGPPGFTRPV